MDLFRKYYDDKQFHTMLSNQPDWGVNIRTVGHNIHRPKTAYPDYQHPRDYCFDWNNGRVLNEFQLVYIPQGSGTFEADGIEERTVESGTVFLLFPGVWHRYKPSELTGWEEFWVGFQGHYADFLMRQDHFKSTTSFVHVGLHPDLLKVFIQLIETVKHEGFAYPQLSSNLVTQLLTMIYAASTTMGRNLKSDRLMQEARYRIHDNFNSDINWQQLASDLHVSYPWFRKAFRESIGTSPGQYHLSLRIEQACRLLKETDLSISQVSTYLGFESDFYFSRIFKKKVGMSPLQYRKN